MSRAFHQLPINSTPAVAASQEAADDRYGGFAAADAGTRLALDPRGSCAGKGPVHGTQTLLLDLW
jgi:hypothetical protein